MLYKCANPVCTKPFRHLDKGKLFQVETEQSPASSTRLALPTRRGRMLRHHIERYWLCDDCASSLTLTFEKGRGIATTPLSGIAKNIGVANAGLGKFKSVTRGPGFSNAAVGRSA